MYQFVSVLVILVSILLVLIVLVQNSKGGGLASNFSASNQVMGVRKTADFLEKATWTLAGSLLILAFVSVMVLPRGQMQSGAAIDEELQNMNVPSQELPDFGIGGEETTTDETAGDSL
ncbi:preprotein translocase subunit SecG [Marinilabilia sp.]|uniref:preprotein translocase subunit SecG n=1 Tax=Marinilabilia sp. TaxID=2021252 RepID=UPI0025BAD4B6|nr:preprotein translocase subunit SecG [Marinilabilia sp.]